jgi:catechol 2,3-dioxygenase-like lactoylglutathione lyase family enzyme
MPRTGCARPFGCLEIRHLSSPRIRVGEEMTTVDVGRPEFFCAVLLVSRNPRRLAEFYRDVLGIPLEEERHDDTEPHYGCEVGDLHFAVHPVENFGGEAPGVGAVKLAFEVFDLDAFLSRLATLGVKALYPPKALGATSRITAVRDPDGNEVEFTQLSPAWFEHLERRRSQGIDVLQRWRALRSK